MKCIWYLLMKCQIKFGKLGKQYNIIYKNLRVVILLYLIIPIGDISLKK